MTTLSNKPALIADFFEAWNDRYSLLRDDPVLAPILERAYAAYRQGKLSSDFSTAARNAKLQAVREILQMDGE